MRKGTFYIRNTLTLNMILENIQQAIPCFINREYIEMDYSEVEIIARIEDWAFVENMLAPLVWKSGLQNFI